MQPKTRSVLTLIAWVIVLLLASLIISGLTKNNMYPWYVNIAKSSLTPPGYAFGIVWPILYVLIAISGWLLWHKDTPQKTSSLQAIFILQLLINWAWTPIFFYYHWIGAGLACIGILVLLVAFVILRARKHILAVSCLLLPYWLWLLFAFYLNYFIWIHN